MAYNIGGEIVFDDLPEYPEDENTFAANRGAYESDIDDGLAVKDIYLAFETGADIS